MPSSRSQQPPPIEPREFRSVEEIDSAIKKLERRVHELEHLDVALAIQQQTGEEGVAVSNIRATILDVFGPNSPEYHEHKYIRMWAGDEFVDMHPAQIVQGVQLGRTQVIGIINGLIGRLREKRDDLTGGATPAPATYFDRLNLHPRILDVSRDLFLDGHPWEQFLRAQRRW